MNPNEANGFDQKWRDRFEGFRPEVPPKLWDKIAAQLDTEDSGPVVPLTKGRRRFPAWWMSVAATLLVVCGAIYWQDRPVAVTYLQAAAVPEEEQLPAQPVEEVPVEEAAPAVEPLDLDRLKRVFARKNRRSASVDRHRSPLGTEVQPLRPIERQEVRSLVFDGERVASTPTPADTVGRVEQRLADVPEIQPPVPQEATEETLLATAAQPRQPFGISNLLNYVVGAVDPREEKLVTFSNDDEGSLKLDFNLGLAKNKKNKRK